MPAIRIRKGGTIDQRQSACDLKFGTSTGALGLRKFPNPRFEAQKWKQLNGGSVASWDGFRKQMIKATGIPSDERVSKLADASYEPPFLIGTACGSCHIAFDPLNPPKDPAHPKWENIKGLVGNQYSRMSELLGSGMPKTSIEWQMFTHARPGVTDTSAISHDQVNNPGTMNSIINLAQRPLFAGEVITKWRKTDTCGGEKDEDKCWCERGRDNKCWLRSTRSDDKTLDQRRRPSHPERRGGLDRGARSDPEGLFQHRLVRRSMLGESPHGPSPGRSCPARLRPDAISDRAVPARLPELPRDRGPARQRSRISSSPPRATRRICTSLAIASARRTDSRARDYTRQDLIADLDREFGPDAVRRGRVLFAENCARCHSSLPDTPADSFKTRDFYAVAEDHPRKVRKDFLGNDASTPATEVGTFRCRALHSNHVAGHLYSEYGSETLRAKPVVADIPERGRNKDNGRGYYRNVSLLNVWATAPFMHNNAIGPEVCGKPKNPENDFFRSRYVDASGKLVDPQPQCMAYDPSVDGPLRALQAVDARAPASEGARHQADAHRLRRRGRHRPSQLGWQDGKGPHRQRRRDGAEGQLRRPAQRLRAQAVHRRPVPRKTRSGAPRGGRQEGDHSRASGHRRRRAEEPGAVRRRPEGAIAHSSRSITRRARRPWRTTVTALAKTCPRRTRKR